MLVSFSALKTVLANDSRSLDRKSSRLLSGAKCGVGGW